MKNKHKQTQNNHRGNTTYVTVIFTLDFGQVECPDVPRVGHSASNGGYCPPAELSPPPPPRVCAALKGGSFPLRTCFSGPSSYLTPHPCPTSLHQCKSCSSFLQCWPFPSIYSTFRTRSSRQFLGLEPVVPRDPAFHSPLFSDLFSLGFRGMVGLGVHRDITEPAQLLRMEVEVW